MLVRGSFGFPLCRCCGHLITEEPFLALTALQRKMWDFLFAQYTEDPSRTFSAAELDVVIYGKGPSPGVKAACRQNIYNMRTMLQATPWILDTPYIRLIYNPRSPYARVYENLKELATSLPPSKN